MEDECLEELGRPISSLKNAELKDELTKRGLTKTGNKKELTDRLRAAIQKRSSSQQSGDVDFQQQQQQLQQNVPQYINAAVAIQQNQACQHQLNQMQTPPQAQLAVYTTPINQQQYQQTMMQPLDLQQQLADYQTQVQFAQSAEYQQQQLQQQLQLQQQEQELLQQQEQQQQEQQQQEQQQQEQQQQEQQQQEQQQQEQQQLIAQQQLVAQQQCQASTVATQPPIDMRVPQQQQSVTPEQSIDLSSKSTFSLKRGISELSRLSNSLNKEKRRKWTSKSTVSTAQESAPPGETMMTGGISSQKLQELIEVKAAEHVAKSSKQANIAHKESTQDLKGSAQDSKEGQTTETADEPEPRENSGQDKLTEKVALECESGPDKVSDDPEPEPESEPTSVLLVQNLVRPFTLMQLKEVLTKHGPMIDEKFWTDKVKSKCCVMYESIEVAQLTKESLHCQRWPSSNPKTLKISYVTEETLIQCREDETKSFRVEAPENGNDKSIVNRLGERLDDGDGTAGDQVKRRLGERVSGEVSMKSSNVNRDGDNSQPLQLDDLFKKTKAVPNLFWLPLTESEADVRQKQRESRKQEAPRKLRRSTPRRHSRSPIRHRSPPGRRSPPPRHRSPIRHRSPPPRHRSPSERRSPPPRHRSPLLRHRTRSPLDRRSPLVRRSPLDRHSPPRRRLLPRHSPPRHRSPLANRSPVKRRTPPMRSSPPRRRLPGPIRRSPVSIHRSPGPMRRSPGPIRRSPGLMRRSPMHLPHEPLERSPGPIRRSPGRHRPIRRSPAPIRRKN